ncbi:hypothetical protein BDQ17DRAFT_1333817 [Cyathus striatus]|nr:hypothetical protein BDQ17DRAFT_1333817 [Cyathus striatus]
MSSVTVINVAVAGVTSGLGNAIAIALVANPSVSVTLLTRLSSTSTGIPEVLQPLVDNGAIIRSVDYASIQSIAEALRGIRTVISTLATSSDTTAADNLLEGAKAAGVKRFAPSEFSIAKESNSSVEFYRTKAVYWEKVKGSGMEHTAFRNGMFMDYFAKGSLKYKGPLRMETFMVDVGGRKAEIPGTGDEMITLTTLADIGKFVSAAVTLDTWPEEMGMSGETLTFNQIVQVAEEVLGQKFNVTYVSKEELTTKQVEGIEKKDWFRQFSAEVYLAIIAGEGEIRNPYLNHATNVQPMKVKEFLETYWSNMRLGYNFNARNLPMRSVNIVGMRPTNAYTIVEEERDALAVLRAYAKDDGERVATIGTRDEFVKAQRHAREDERGVRSIEKEVHTLQFELRTLPLSQFSWQWQRCQRLEVTVLAMKSLSGEKASSQAWEWQEREARIVYSQPPQRTQVQCWRARIPPWTIAQQLTIGQLGLRVERGLP